MKMCSRFIAAFTFIATAGLAVAFPGGRAIRALVPLQSTPPWPSNFGNAQNTAVGFGSGANADLEWQVASTFLLQDNYGCPVVAGNGSIYVFDNVSFLGQTTGVLRSINPATGSINWGFTLPSTTGTTPAIGPDGTIYIANGSTIYALIDNGSSYGQKWQVNVSLSGGATLGSPNIAPNGTVYCVSSDGFLIGVTDGGTSGTLALQSRFFINATTFAPAIGSDGTVYVGYSNVVGAFDGSSGEELWEFGADSNIASPIAIGSGNLYFESQDSIYSISASSGSGNWSDLFSQFVPDNSFQTGNIAVGANGVVYAAFAGILNGDYFDTLVALNATNGS
jgi:hypothetical protein